MKDTTKLTILLSYRDIAVLLEALQVFNRQPIIHKDVTIVERKLYRAMGVES